MNDTDRCKQQYAKHLYHPRACFCSKFQFKIGRADGSMEYSTSIIVRRWLNETLFTLSDLNVYPYSF